MQRHNLMTSEQTIKNDLQCCRTKGSNVLKLENNKLRTFPEFRKIPKFRSFWAARLP